MILEESGTFVGCQRIITRPRFARNKHLQFKTGYIEAVKEPFGRVQDLGFSLQ